MKTLTCVLIVSPLKVFFVSHPLSSHSTRKKTVDLPDPRRCVEAVLVCFPDFADGPMWGKMKTHPCDNVALGLRSTTTPPRYRHAPWTTLYQPIFKAVHNICWAYCFLSPVRDFHPSCTLSTCTWDREIHAKIKVVQRVGAQHHVVRPDGQYSRLKPVCRTAVCNISYINECRAVLHNNSLPSKHVLTLITGHHRTRRRSMIGRLDVQGRSNTAVFEKPDIFNS